MCAVNGRHYERRNKYKTGKKSPAAIFFLRPSWPFVASVAAAWFHIRRLRSARLLTVQTPPESLPPFRHKRVQPRMLFMDLFPTTRAGAAAALDTPSLVFWGQSGELFICTGLLCYSAAADTAARASITALGFLFLVGLALCCNTVQCKEHQLD